MVLIMTFLISYAIIDTRNKKGVLLMTKILMICHGNICRSPMAEFVLKDLLSKQGLSDQFEIASAATSREELGNDIHRGTKAKLSEMHIPHQSREARQVTRTDYDYYDYLICMDHHNLHNLDRITGKDRFNKVSLLLDHTDRVGQDIADPWYTGNFDTTYNDILDGCKGFLASIF